MAIAPRSSPQPSNSAICGFASWRPWRCLTQIRLNPSGICTLPSRTCTSTSPHWVKRAPRICRRRATPWRIAPTRRIKSAGLSGGICRVSNESKTTRSARRPAAISPRSLRCSRIAAFKVAKRRTSVAGNPCSISRLSRAIMPPFSSSISGGTSSVQTVICEERCGNDFNALTISGSR